MKTTSWQIMVVAPNPERMAVGTDSNGNTIYTGPATIQVPWDGKTIADADLPAAFALVVAASPDHSFSVKGVG